MKTLFTNILLLFLSIPVFAQYIDRTAVCGTDTITAYRRLYEPYKALACSQPSNIGIRIEVGRSSFHYNENTAAYLGVANGALFGFSIIYRNISLTARFNIVGTRPRKNIDLEYDTITTNGKINPAAFDYTLGYSLNLPFNTALEPHAGLSKNTIYAWRVHDDGKEPNYTLPKIYGFTAGITINKYFKIHDLDFLSAFLSGGYSTANFQKANRYFGKGYFEWSFGVAYKAFYFHHYDKPIR